MTERNDIEKRETGKCIERSDIRDEIVYKNFYHYWGNQDYIGGGSWCFDIDEYVIGRKGDKPDESKNLILSLSYKCFHENNKDTLKVLC